MFLIMPYQPELGKLKWKIGKLLIVFIIIIVARVLDYFLIVQKPQDYAKNILLHLVVQLAIPINYKVAQLLFA